MTGSPTVTVPAVPAKIAEPDAHAAFGLPAAVVQFVLIAFQVPVPPLTTLFDVVCAPSQDR